MTEELGTPKPRNALATGVALAIVGLLAVALIVKLAGFNRLPSSPQQIDLSPGQVAQKSGALPCGPMVASFVDVDSLAAAYEENEAAAQRDFGDRCVPLVGTVDGVYLNLVDEPSVRLKLGADDTLTVNLAEPAYPLAANLQKGQRAQFICAEVSEFLGSPTLHECVFAQAKP